MRLNRFLARSGVASRRKAEDVIISGRVKVNGRVVTELATEVAPVSDNVEVDGELVRLPVYKYFSLNKPAGYTCTRADAHAEKTIFELLPNDKSLITVGRLDRETTGLILITNDGDFAQNIIHPSKKISKVYRIKLRSFLTDEQLRKLRGQILLEDGPAQATTIKVISNKELELTIEEGRKRIVRRMIRAVGNEIVELERISIGHLKLDTKTGEFRELTPKEVAQYV
jgi:23S rRNA pseudouridine2605 synthase